MASLRETIPFNIGVHSGEDFHTRLMWALSIRIGMIPDDTSFDSYKARYPGTLEQDLYQHSRGRAIDAVWEDYYEMCVEATVG